VSKRDRTGTPTERALVRMLMENTGRHFLDSGGAYGRDWERNQARGLWTAAQWLQTPEIWSDAWGSSDTDEDDVETSTGGSVTLSVFHYLRQRLEFNSQLTAWLFREEDGNDDPWLVSMERWAEARHEGDAGDYWQHRSFNSYNEDNLLSQTIQGVTFTYQDQAYVALQIHGGADVRGGYTRPKVFAVTTDEAWSLFDWNKWSFGHVAEYKDTQDPLPGMTALPKPEEHYWDHDGYQSWVDHGGTFVTMDAYEEHGHVDGKDLVWERRGDDPWRPRCPIDGTPCEIYAPQAW